MNRSIRLPKLLALPLAFLIASPLMGQAPEATDREAGLRQLVRQLYAQGEFHGGILIADGEDIVLEQAWGIADHEEGQVLTPQHRFSINSQGKMFTGILVMQLVERGRLALDDPLSRHMPDFGHPRAGDVTIHMLLSHRSGLPDYFINQLRGVLPWGLDVPGMSSGS